MDAHSYLKSFSIIHRFSIMYHIKALKKYKIAGHQMGYIMRICEKPGTSQEDLACFFGLNKGSVAKGIRSLVQEGYVERVQNQQDKRAYHLYPTKKADELFAVAKDITETFGNILTKNMTEQEKELFQMLLTRACDNIMEAAGDSRHELERPGPPPDAHFHGPHGPHGSPACRR